jgi:hypothetical protein
MKNLKSVRVWVYGFAATIITGGATAGSSWLGMTAAKAIGIDVPVLNFKALGIICLCGGVTSALAYLKQSPLPKLEDDAAPGNPS